MSSNKPSGTSQVVSNTAPWTGQQPFLSTGFEKAKGFLDQPLQYYPDSTVVPFSPQTEQSLNLAENRASLGSPLQTAGQGAIMDTVEGNYLNSNPYLSKAIDTAVDPLVRNYTQAVKPGIDSAFSKGGRYGSPGGQGAALDNSQQNLARAIGDISGSMAYQNYNSERSNMLNAAMASPQMAQQDYFDIQQLANVGQTRESQAGSQLQDQINRFMFEQQSPRDALAEYMAMVGGGSYGGQTVTQQPIYSNSLATGLGAAATGAGVLGSLFGGGGVWPGALKFGP